MSNLCKCGCKRKVKEDKKFISGHNSRTKKFKKHLKWLNSLLRTQKQKEASRKNVQKATLISAKLERTKKQIETCKKNGLKRKGCKISEKQRKYLKTFTQEKHSKWKGEKIITEDGYVLVPHPNGKGRIQEHFLIIKKYLGRFPKGREETHHLDKNPSNNNINNLILCKNTQSHRKFHWKKEITKKDIVFDGRTIQKE